MATHTQAVSSTNWQPIHAQLDLLQDRPVLILRSAEGKHRIMDPLDIITQDYEVNAATMFLAGVFHGYSMRHFDQPDLQNFQAFSKRFACIKQSLPTSAPKGVAQTES